MAEARTEPTTAYLDLKTAQLLDNYISSMRVPTSRSAVLRAAVRAFCHGVEKHDGRKN